MQFSKSLRLQRFGSLFFCLLLALQFNNTMAAQSSEPIGTAKLALGRVTATDLSGVTVSIKRGSPLYQGYTITTGGRSFLRAEMLDGTRFTLGKNATASLTGFQFDEAARTGTFAANVVQGGFEYVSGKIGTFSRRRHSTITTPTAIIGIRGSKVKGTVSRSRTLVVLESGLLSITGPTGLNRTTLNPGNSSEIGSDGVPDFTDQATPQQQQEIAESLPTPEEVQTATVAVAEEEEEEADDEDEEEGDDEGDDEGDEAAEADAEAEDTAGDADVERQVDSQEAEAEAEAPPPPTDEPLPPIEPPPPAPTEPLTEDSPFTPLPDEPIASPSGEAPP
ncbi:MAG: hypothetical protein O6945_08895 [Gammaproteobacteria bacterium]|nr:hypothetical protein [Gammaproteobacteria bacterium]